MSQLYYIVNVEGVVAKGDRYLMIVRGAEESHGAGALTPPGGKVENVESARNVLEETLRREIAEEAGVQIHDGMTYLESNAFVTDQGEPVVDVVFLCQYRSGSPLISDPGEVAALHWMTAAEILSHPRAAEWTRRSIELAEQARRGQRW